MGARIPRPLYRLAFWLYSLGQKFDLIKPWKLPRILRSIRAARANRNRPRSEREIVFICDHPTPRDAKLSQALRERGWRCVLLLRKAPQYDPLSFFDKFETYRDAWEALEKSSTYTPTAYHVVSSWSFRTAVTIIRYPPGKVVFDNTDQLAGMVRRNFLWRNFPWQLGLERYCLENAEALRCRDLSSQLARRVLGYKIRGKRIWFPDYGWGRFRGVAERPLESRELSVVFIGSMALEKFQPNNRYDHYLKVVTAIVSRGIPFHLYGTVGLSAKGFEDTFSDYLDLAKLHPVLHVHRPVPPETMAEELSRYAVALYVIGNPLHLGSDDLLSIRERTHYSMSSRFYDYVEAGLVIVTHEGRMSLWLCRRYGIGFLAGPELFARPREWLLEQTARLRRKPGIEQEWTMPRQIERMERFYKAL